MSKYGLAICLIAGAHQVHAMQLAKPQLIKALATNTSALRLSRFTSSQSSSSQHRDNDAKANLETIERRLEEIENQKFEEELKAITDPVERERRTLLRQAKKLRQEDANRIGADIVLGTVGAYIGMAGIVYMLIG
jgi:hypothetical protein